MSEAQQRSVTLVIIGFMVGWMVHVVVANYKYKPVRAEARKARLELEKCKKEVIEVRTRNVQYLNEALDAYEKLFQSQIK